LRAGRVEKPVSAKKGRRKIVVEIKTRRTMKKFNITFRTLTIAMCLLAGATLLRAQQGQTGVGLRMGTDPGITIKHFVAPHGAIEGILGTGYRGLLLTGLYEWHKGIGTEPGLKIYGGLGGHFGVFNRYAYYRKGPYYDVVYVYNQPSFGPDFIVGMEYDFTEIPLNIGLDLKPAVDFYGGYSYMYLDGALSLRVLF